MEDNAYTYVIDDEDRIVRLSPNWEAFATLNGCDKTLVEQEIGRPVWDFIQGAETKHLYRTIFAKARSGVKTAPIPFRCDSPAYRRYLQIEMVAHSNGWIKITSTILRTESRNAIRALDSSVPRSESFLRICSMCKRVPLPEGQWVELEEAVAALHLFDDAFPPQLTHSLCPDCYRKTMSALDAEMGEAPHNGSTGEAATRADS